MIHVCSLARLHDTVRETGARHVRRIAGRDVVHPHRLARRRRAWSCWAHRRGDRIARHRYGGVCERTVPTRSGIAMAEAVLTPIEIGLTAAIVAVEDGEPAI